MKTTRTILQAVAMTVLAAFMLVVGLASAGNATGPGTHYTDGTETYEGQFPAPADGPEGYGPPPEMSHYEDIDGVSHLCVDPPSFVDITFHTSINDVEQEAVVANYDGEFIFHEVAHTCIPEDQPVCLETEQVDQHIVKWTTWNIGSGRSAELVIDLDCTPEVPVPPVVPPVELAPPIVPAVAVPVEGETPPVEGQLPVTGSGTIALALFGAAVSAIGFAMARGSKAKRGLNV